MTLKPTKPARVSKTTVPISETNIRKAAARLLTTKLVSTEMMYVQRTLGSTATQDQLDAQVLAVRALPWSDIVQPD